MPDDFDRAQDRVEIDLAQALAAQREAAKSTAHPTPTGFCLNPACEEDFAGDEKRLFCGPVCASECARRAR